MCTFGLITSYVRCVINQRTRPLLVNAHRRGIATREFYRCYCRTICAESSARNAVCLSHCTGRPSRVLYGYSCLHHLASARFMSSEQKPSITEEILKSKLDETMKTAGPDPNHKESKTSSDKSDSWFSGKNAWKLGLLSLAGMGVLMCGNLLIVWGKLKIYTLIHHCTS